MAYRSEYQHREIQREDDRDTKQGGGWKSWFGLGSDNKDEDRGYNYSKTTTYRDTQPSYGYSAGERYPERTGYSANIGGGYTGARGGYGYTTSDEVNRGPSWTTDRDYTTRGGYGTSGDRDVYYKQETRTYGGDRDYAAPTRGYGFSGEQRPVSRGFASSGPYGYSSDQPQARFAGDYTYSGRNQATGGESRDYTYSSRYPTTGGESRDYTYSSRYPTTGGESRDLTYNSRYPVTGGESRDLPYNSRYPTTTGDRDYAYKQEARTYGGDYNTSAGRTYGGEYNVPSSRYGYSGDRDTGRYTTGAGYTSGGYGGDREYPRPSYQQSSYSRY